MMSINYKYSISTLLLLSCGLLGILVPGGAIETRDFSHINPLVLGIFNTFLTVLVMISILIIYYLLQNINWAYIVALICGISYLLVYVFDLAKVFPVSPSAMPQTLLTIEILGSLVSLPLIFLSVEGWLIMDRDRHPQVTRTYSQGFAYFALLLSIIGLGIIIFATNSAMGI